MDWKCPPPPLVLFRKLICFGSAIRPGVHKLFQPTSRAGSTWSKFGARGEHGECGEDGKHGDVLRFSNLDVLRLSENRAPIIGEPCSRSWRTVLRFQGS